MQQKPGVANPPSPKRLAYQFIILMGMVSLFGDIIYEGARSITGPFMATLGASAVVVGLVAGLGEFLGYALRLGTGYLADRTKAYWPLTMLGYGMILAVPLLAWAGNWQLAAVFIIVERMGKAVRSPARDALLSHATKQVGRGWGFAIHEALDQIGAIAGPLLFTAVFLLKGSYAQGFKLLWIPCVLLLGFLIYNRMQVPEPEKLETDALASAAGAESRQPSKLPRIFWLYMVFIFLTVAGFANFQLISFHLKAHAVATDAQIPLLYALAMGVDAVVALIIGKVYDRVGLRALLVIPLLTVPIPFLAFTRQMPLVIVSVVLWGAVMGIHETIMRAAIADLAPLARRGYAYGIFNTAYGLSWLIGGVAMGGLYDISLPAVMVLTVALQIVSLPVFYLLGKAKA